MAPMSSDAMTTVQGDGVVYVDPGAVARHPSRTDAPASGTGTVWILELEGIWDALWHDDEHFLASPKFAERADVVAWALEQPAADRVIFNVATSEYEPLTS